MTHGYDGKRWVCYWHGTGWENIALGVSICVTAPNIEVHLPFGFVRIGRKSWPAELDDLDLHQPGCHWLIVHPPDATCASHTCDCRYAMLVETP